MSWMICLFGVGSISLFTIVQCSGKVKEQDGDNKSVLIQPESKKKSSEVVPPAITPPSALKPPKNVPLVPPSNTEEETLANVKSIQSDHSKKSTRAV